MAHYAFINEQNIVVEVIVGRDEDDLPEGINSWEEFYTAEKPGLVALRTSYNTYGGQYYDAETGKVMPLSDKAYRKNYAGIGFTYDPDRDAFIPPKPFESWLLNEETCLWEPPIPYPNDGAVYEWDESAGDWVEIV